MLTKISATTAFLALLLNVLVLTNVPWFVDLSTEALGAINLAIVGAGTAIHAWVNPAIPLGNTTPTGG